MSGVRLSRHDPRNVEAGLRTPSPISPGSQGFRPAADVPFVGVENKHERRRKSAIEEAARTARHYADMIIKEPAQAIGSLLNDKVNYWSWKNKIKLLLKAKKFVEDKRR